MKIEITIAEHNIGYSFTDEKGKDLRFEHLPRQEQIRILNSFAKGYQFWKLFLKEEEKQHEKV